MISLSTISLAQALMLFILPLSIPYALCLFYVFYKPFKAFLRLAVNVSKVGVQPAACEKIGVCNFAVLLQIVQMPLSPCAYGLFFFSG